MEMPIYVMCDSECLIRIIGAFI